MSIWHDLTEDDAHWYGESYRNRITGQKIRAVGRQRIRAAIRQKTGKHSRVLDVGCGKATQIAELYHSARYVGVDQSPELLRIARKHNEEYEFVEADAECLPYADKIFPHVICHFMLEYAETPETAREAFDEMVRVGNTVWIAWELPPQDGPTMTRTLHGLVPDPLPQHTLSMRLFDRGDITIAKRKISGRHRTHELWRISQR